ncbi:beta-1,3-glucan-binding protein-like [Patella vulgata]|uniref:beta-1,3-glucan-binding protein-like n=1 Tax=Patella vulgata TaxID=6465 RepID=UPI0024A93ED4|nr:beta-1,3-glucan-binding protein-like [Patella vulgata]
MLSLNVFLFLIPLVFTESLIPTIKPRINKDEQGRISFHIHDEPGNLIEVIVTTEVNKDVNIGKATLNKASNEWDYSTSYYQQTDVDQLRYMISYIFNTASNSQKTYHGTIQFNSGTAVQPAPHPLSRRGTVVFHDDFNGHTLDKNKWYHEVTANGGGNGEFQVYTAEAANTFVRNGVLYLKPTLTSDKFGESFLHSGTLDLNAQFGSCTASWENGCLRKGSQHNIPPIMSSKIYSKATIRHGRVDVVAQIPKGDWLWPAIWMLPQGTNWKYGGWPRSGEIDIMESRGNVQLNSGGSPQGAARVLSTIHLGTDGGGGHRQHGEGKVASNGKTWADGYHTYSLDWTENHIKMMIDNQPVLAWNTPSEGYFKHENLGGSNIWSSGGKDAPFDTNFALILNVAVGGDRGYFPDGWNNGGNGAKPWTNFASTAMMDFWNNRQQWQKTWHGDDVAMKIKSVTMTQY